MTGRNTTKNKEMRNLLSASTKITVDFGQVAQLLCISVLTCYNDMIVGLDG